MGLVMGIGFPVFRGGALRYIDQMGVKAFVEMADRYADLGKLYQVTDSLREMAAKGESFFK
jgi:3-hydroxyacyl-CoA dehydrogenase/enoyl-CoA hydratase/3-hydroxybutyryl-CoA epimerase/enoyl-CoA isomerase